jgi:CheY-like chemotaxis protein
MPTEFEPEGPTVVQPLDPAALTRVRGLRVLVVDPDARDRLCAIDLLNRFGCTAIGVASGSEAVLSAQAGRFDAFIVDIGLPDRPAHEWYDQLRLLLPQATPFMMTGFDYDRHHSIPKARVNGLRATLYKPLMPDQVLAALVGPQPAETP